jgi:hypothetical protein
MRRMKSCNFRNKANELGAAKIPKRDPRTEELKQGAFLD